MLADVCRRDRLIDRSTSDALDRRRIPETELLRPCEPTPMTLTVAEEDATLMM